MKKNLITICSIMLFSLLMFSSCQKETALVADTATASKLAPSDETKLILESSKVALSETRVLIRKWIEWVATRDYELHPWDDATGAKQYAAQPYASGTMLLSGGGSPVLENREITISLSQYQQIFIPVVNYFSYWSDCFPGHPEENVPNGGISHYITEALNGKRTLTLNWDGNSLLPDKLKDLRENSGFWEVAVHPSWTGGCVSTSTTFYADGFWATIPLTLGVHQLEVAGDVYSHRDKSAFSNHVIYTINVTD